MNCIRNGSGLFHLEAQQVVSSHSSCASLPSITFFHSPRCSSAFPTPAPSPCGIDKSDADINIHMPYTVCTHCTPNSGDSCGNHNDHDDMQMLMHSAIIQLHCKLDRWIGSTSEGGWGGGAGTVVVGQHNKNDVLPPGPLLQLSFTDLLRDEPPCSEPSLHRAAPSPPTLSFSIYTLSFSLPRPAARQLLTPSRTRPI